MATKTLIKSDTHHHFIVPTYSLACLVARSVRRRKVKYNYCSVHRQREGYLVQLAVADWIPEGQFSISGARYL